MTILLVAEHDHKQLDTSFAHALTAVRSLNQDVVVLILGHQCTPVAEAAAAYQGVGTVWLVEDPAFEHPLVEQMGAVIAQLAHDFDYIVMASTTLGKNVLPRVAGLLDLTQVSDVSVVVSADTFERPIYAGNALETVQILDKQKILSIRVTSFNATMAQQSPCLIQKPAVQVPGCATSFVGRELSQSVRPDLANAKIIVSGGRGLQSKEQFKLLEDLADKLGAALGASRAAVDAGFISNDHQVGQTGKIVAPKLYFAIGISGAIQHIAGIKDAQIIVAINKDDNAPIFQVANYGLVGDLFELIPQLVLELQQRGLSKC
jgi:electron transfer flavoprotein alpha subunit